MQPIRRFFRHLITTRWSARARFSKEVLDAIESAVHDVERRHAGEIRFVVETAFDFAQLWEGLTPRERALQIFGQTGVWDTEANNGVLIYVLLADHDVEILADRGIARRVSQAEWEAVCHEMETHYRAGRFKEGSIAGVQGVGRLLAQHFPGDQADTNELPNQPVLL